MKDIERMKNMNEIIKINSDNKVSGRELHEFLEVETRYNDWFQRMTEYGFIDGTDFYSKMSKTSGGRPSVDHIITIDMAKEICMIQRTEKGKQARQYFIECEKRLKGQKPMSQLEILAGATQALLDQQREIDRIKMANEKQEKEMKVLNSRVDTMNGVCITGDKQQKLNQMIRLYATRNGLQYSEGWHKFRQSYNTGYHTNITAACNRFAEKQNIKKLSIPAYLMKSGYIDDGLVVADKMLNGVTV